MKYVPLRSFEDVTDALNFENDGTYVVGGCDLYITKAGGSDKKLYAKIESDLQARHQSLLTLAASLSPPQAAKLASSENLSRSSPFGTLSEISNRRVFAYLVTTLNASHPDYDFSNVLQPTDFVRKRRLEDVMENINENIASAHNHSYLSRNGARTPGGSMTWGPRMWSLIDQEMGLEDCAIYSFEPAENPFDDEEMALWSVHYFFFNKTKKRVCYLYLRAVKVSLYEYVNETTTPIKRRLSARYSQDFDAERSGAGKRAKFWLGDRADELQGYGDDVEVIVAPGDDEVDVDLDPDFVDDMVRNNRSLSPISISSDDDEDSDEVEEVQTPPRKSMKSLDVGGMRKNHVRSVSEGIAEAMEV